MEGGRKWGLERTEGGTLDREQRRSEAKTCARGPAKRLPAGVGMGTGGKYHPVPKGLLDWKGSFGNSFLAK